MTERIIQGDCREILRGMTEKSVQCVVTSPPYFGLRDYGLEPLVWGGIPDCDHVDNGPCWIRSDTMIVERDPPFCPRGCGAWRGSLGLEPTIEMYVEHLVEVLREVKRVLRDDGLVFLNLGDRVVEGVQLDVSNRCERGLANDGWLLVRRIIWHKPDANLDTSERRPRMNYEMILLFAKTLDWYWDVHALPSSSNRAVWSIATSNFKGAHTAVFPFELVRRCIAFGTSEKGCCPECGAPWKRKVEKDRQPTRPALDNKQDGTGMANRDHQRHVTEVRTVGWEPGCGCVMLGRTFANRTMDIPLEPVECTILDCFSGAGTVGVVCKKLGLRFIGIELNPDYCEMARKRIANPEPLPEPVDVPGQMELKLC